MQLVSIKLIGIHSMVLSQGNSRCLVILYIVLSLPVSGHSISRLSSLVLCVLSAVGRPVEVATLKKLLSDTTTRAQAECFLRYTVVDHLVRQLQSPNVSQVFGGDIRPLLVESSTDFLMKVGNQYPVTKQRCSCPASF